MAPEELEALVRRVVTEELDAAFARHLPRPDPRQKSRAEAAALVRTPASTVRFWIWQGKLTAYKPGRVVLVKEAELLAHVEANEGTKKRAAAGASRFGGTPRAAALPR